VSKDVFHLCCVSTEWCNLVESSSGLDWKQVLTNAFGLQVTDKFAECSSSALLLGFDLAKSLGKSGSPRQNAAYDPPTKTTQEFFVVVDFYNQQKQGRKTHRVTVGSLVVDDIRDLLKRRTGDCTRRDSTFLRR
jgi:hypothetical protein